MLRNLASNLFLTERDAQYDENAPKVKGRIITTLQKAKEVRPLIEKCITLATQALRCEGRAEPFDTDAERDSDQWREWRSSAQWQQWNQAISPAVAARRRALKLLGNKEAVRVLFDEIAPRFADRGGGYTRILRLATPRLGDAGTRAILELVGVRDRVSRKSEKPAYAKEKEEMEEAAADRTAQAKGQENLEERASEEASAREAVAPEREGESPERENDHEENQ